MSRMKYEITEVDVMSLGKVSAIIYGAAGALMWLFVPLFLVLPINGDGEGMFARGLMMFFFVAAPIIQAVMGFIMGMIAGTVYNLLSRSFGGLRITLNQEA
ncbi:MAG: hypothetical protein E4H28_06095 [Gemmatimonadales bacterium]|nr:MAG: hypothetical protein E4H28_06095 [Gemmatimonadales bacterium]